jgi:hypothetical protein
MRYGETVLSSGTGFVVESGNSSFLITNRHNVTGRNNVTGKTLSSTGGVPNNIVIYHNVLGSLGVWAPKVEPLLVEDVPQWREHPRYGSRADVVAIKLRDLEGVQLYPYPLTEKPRIAIGPSDVVSVVGFPFGMSTGGRLPIWATGFIASEPYVNPNDSDLPVFYIDCRSRPGQSGSAVIAHRNGGMVALEGGASAAFGGPVTRLLGVYSGRVNEQSDIGIVWRTSCLRGLIEEAASSTLAVINSSAQKLNW